MSADRVRAVLEKLRELERATQARDSALVIRLRFEAIAMLEGM